MIKFLIHRPIAVIMVFIAAVVLGIIAYQSLPVSLMPDIPIPQVTVNVTYKNSSARELENAVVKPVRAQLMQVGHLSQIKSQTRDGQATVNLQFDYGTNVDLAFIEVNEKIDAAMNSLPRDMDRPRVVKASATDIPVFYLNLSLKDIQGIKADGSEEVDNRFMELSEFAESVIRKRIEQLPEVAMVDISGTVSPQLVIEPDMQKLQQLQLTLTQLENTLSQNNVNAGSLTVRDGHYQYNIRFTSVLRNAEDVKNIYLKASGKIFQLKDIATVNIEPQKRNGMFAANGKPAITMAVIKQANAKLADMKDQIKELVDRFEKDYPGMHFEASQDQTQLLDYSISNLRQNLSQGLWLVIIVVFLFMKDLKLPLLIGLSLMVSVVISLLFFSMMHLSINIISLAGLILAVGNMMDNSIVVTDNISQYRERNYSVDDACIAGTGEVIIPQLSSMLVNVAVFIPLIFLSGIAGALMYDEAMSVTIGLAVSYLVGITFMPVIYRLAYRHTYKAENKIQQAKEKFFHLLGKHTKKFFDLDKVYSAGLNFTFRYKRWNIFMYLLMLPIGVAVLFFIRKEKMPAFPQTEVIITIDWNENIHAGENKSRVCRLLKAIESKTIQSNSFIGHQQFLLNRDQEMGASEARIYVKTSLPENIAWIQSKVTGSVTREYHSAKVGFEPPTSIFEKLFSSSEPPLQAEITMKNHDREMDIPELLRICTKLNGDKTLMTSNKIPLQQHIVLTVDMEKLLLYNVSYEVLSKKLKTAFKENNAGTLRSFQRFIPMVISGKEKLVTDIIGSCYVYNNENVQIPISALVRISKGQDLKTITAGKEGEYVPMTYSPSSRQKNAFIHQINTQVHASNRFDVHYSGSLFSNITLLNEIGFVLIISVLLLYFILAAQFESLVQPLLVLLEIPIDFAAALLVLYITGQTLNLMSAMGMVIMSGIIITDSILKLDVINQLRKEGYPLMQAIREGGHRRLRAILMTSLTSILAMIPLLFSSDLGSELQKPFSYALIGGMVIGTIVSLYLVPLVYYFIYRKNEGNERNEGNED
jgi:multidrug efflux pump subunit AcrB